MEALFDRLPEPLVCVREIGAQLAWSRGRIREIQQGRRGPRRSGSARRSQPPRKNVVARPEITMTFRYSAKKNEANRAPPYSVL